MNIWLTTDTHFNHRKLEEYSSRPAYFEKNIMDGFTKNLKPGDMLIHLGDICIGKDEEMHNTYIMPFNGWVKKILVRGNHDGKSDNWYLNHGWDFVCREFSNWYFGKFIQFSHIPRLPDKRFNMNIHGHTHGNAHRKEDEFNSYYDPLYHKELALEKTNYQPLNLESWITSKTNK